MNRKFYKSRGPKTPLKKAIAKLDAVFSQYIRLRDSNEHGIGRCITCGRFKFWKEADCGHYIKRQHYSTRWDEKNCSLQCKACNAFEQGANEKYKIAIDQKWGAGTSDLLEVKKKNKFKLYLFWLEEQIKVYNKKKSLLQKNGPYIL